MDNIKTVDFTNYTILVVGDYILDKYVGGDVERIFPEAPVPVLKTTWCRDQLGGAGNVVNNIRSLLAKTKVLTCIGNDESGRRLESLLTESGADVSCLIKYDEVSTIEKTRVVAKNQQVIRIDREVIDAVPMDFFDYVSREIETIMTGVDAIIISDYGKGIITEDLTQTIIKESSKRGLPVLVDPKGTDWYKYRGATICTPNLSELSLKVGKKIAQDQEDIIMKEASSICSGLDMDYLLVTRSERGMSLISKDGKKRDFPAKKKEVIDVSGAGDTVISMMALSMVANMDMDTCCHLSNVAAGVVVSKFGTATASIDELVGSVLFDTGRKGIGIDEIEQLSTVLHGQSKKIVFTNGCFDLIHTGHLKTLEYSRSLGDVLIVGLNSDESVRRLKGPRRPILDEVERSAILQALTVVDYVVIFEEDTPERLIRMIRPDVLVKGGDYVNSPIAGKEFVESYGGEVKLVELKEGSSTTSTIDRILERYGSNKG